MTKKDSNKVYKEVNQFHLDEDKGIIDFIEKLSNTGFNAKRLALACKIYEDMLKDTDCRKFFGLAGALVPAGLTKHIVALLNTGKIAGVITTGATLTHDYIENLGFKHKKLHNFQNDAELRQEGINRILDVGATNEAFEKMEISIHEWMEKTYSRD